MLRRLFTLLSAPSLLLCVATVVLWVRSQSVEYVFVWNDVRGNVLVSRQILSANGVVAFGSKHDQFKDSEQGRRLLRLRTPEPGWRTLSLKDSPYTGWAHVWPRVHRKSGA